MVSSQRVRRAPSATAGGGRLLVLLWLIWTAAVVYGSLWPWQDWRDHGLAPWAFLSDPWPRYWTWFDVLSNIALYLPFGFLLAARTRGAAWLVVPACTLAGLVLSTCIEATQGYLPQRIPSLLDCATNTLGAALGALLAVLLRSPWATLQHAIRGWWRPDAHIPGALILGWVALQVLWFAANAGLAGPMLLPSAAGLAPSFNQAPTPAWQMLESGIVTLLIVHGAARAGVRWAMFAAIQGLLGFLILEHVLLGASTSTPEGKATVHALLMLLGLWVLACAGFTGMASVMRATARHWLGTGLACLWPLRTLLMLAAAALSSAAIDQGLGPGLGPSPADPEGLGGGLIALDRVLRTFPIDTSLPPAPGMDAALAIVWGEGMRSPAALTASPVLGRRWQHFDAVIFAAGEAWRWSVLGWFLIQLARESPSGKHSPRPRRRP